MNPSANSLNQAVVDPSRHKQGALAHSLPLPAGVLFLAATSMTFGLACLYLDWRWVLTALLSFLFLLFVTVTGVPAATLAMIIARPAVDSFVYLPIGPLTLGQVWAIILMLLVLYGLATRQMGAPSLKQDAPVLVFICF